MPNIKEYNVDPRAARLDPAGLEKGAQVLGNAAYHKASAAYRGMEFMTQAGREIGGGIEAIGRDVNLFQKSHEDLGQIAQTQDLASSMLLNHTLGLRQAAQQGGLEGAQEYLRDKIIPDLDKAGANFQGNEATMKHWLTQRGELEKHFTEMAISEGSAAHAQQVHEHIQTSVGNFAGAVDGSDMTLDHLVTLHRQGVDAMVGASNLTGAEAAKAKEELYGGSAGIVGADGLYRLNHNPEAFLKSLQDGSYARTMVDGKPIASYLKPEQLQKLEKDAGTQIDAQQLKQSRLNELSARDQFTTLNQKYVHDGYIDKEYIPSLEDLRHQTDQYGHHVFTDQDLDARIGAARRIIQDGPSPSWSTDPKVRDQIVNNIWSPPDAPNHMTQQKLDQMMSDKRNQITQKDYEQFGKWINDNVKSADGKGADAENMKLFKTYMNGTAAPRILQGDITGMDADGNPIGKYTPQSQQVYSDFSIKQTMAFRDGLAQGIKPQDMLTTTGPHALFTQDMLDNMASQLKAHANDPITKLMPQFPKTPEDVSKVMNPGSLNAEFQQFKQQTSRGGGNPQPTENQLFNPAPGAQ
jgi:hypothetical protein